MPISLKIMFVTIVALAATVGYLIKSSISIQKQDKINHAYQTQLNETLLLADKFKSLVNNSINSLKQIAAQDWSVESAASSAKNFIENQKDIDRVFIFEVNLTADSEPKLIYKSSNAFGDSEQNAVGSEVIAKLEELVKNQPVITNFTGDNTETKLGVMIPDVQYLSEGKLVVISGVLNAQNLFIQTAYNIEVVSKKQLVYASDVSLVLNKKLNYPAIIEQALNSQISSSIVEFELNNVKQLGSYAKIDHGLTFITTQPLIKITSSVYATTQKMILVGLMALALAVLVSVSLAKSISRPIQKLTEATEKVSSGNFKIKIPQKSNDEIGALAGSFEIMSSKIEKLLVSQEEKIRLENEMNIAATVQKTLFPENKIKSEYLDIVSHYSPAGECGGDLWGNFINNNKFYFIIADATGHGLPSALITVAAKSTLSLVKRMLEQNIDISPKEILSYANRAVYETSQGKIMMTFFVGRLDLTSGELVYSNAGHNPPWVFSQDKVSSLSLPGTRLGEQNEQFEFKEKTIVLKPGDKLFLYTDGIVENTNSKGEMFDKKRVRDLVKNHLNQGIDKTVSNLLSEFKKFLGTKKTLDDDTTVVLIEFKKLASVQEAA